MGDDLPKLTRPELLSALTHQTRIHAIGVLVYRSASPKELAAELGCSIRHVTYHLKKLEELGMIELVRVDERAAGGRSAEHFFRATRRPWFDRDTWKQIDGPKAEVTAGIMRLINEDIATAITGGTFDGEENHLSRTQLLLDEEGYQELIAFLAATLDGLFDIRDRAANRMTLETKAILTMVHFIQFDLPPPRNHKEGAE
jgi:DNA-binding transcriptional ArsR family regulator